MLVLGLRSGFSLKIGVFGTKISKHLGLESLNFGQNMVENAKKNRRHKSSALTVNWWAKGRRLT